MNVLDASVGENFTSQTRFVDLLKEIRDCIRRLHKEQDGEEKHDRKNWKLLNGLALAYMGDGL